MVTWLHNSYIPHTVVQRSSMYAEDMSKVITVAEKAAENMRILFMHCEWTTCHVWVLRQPGGKRKSRSSTTVGRSYRHLRID